MDAGINLSLAALSDNHPRLKKKVAHPSPDVER
jgi:hypothetical protein